MDSVRISRGRVVPLAFCFVGTLLVFVTYLYIFDTFNELTFIVLGIIISPILPIIWTTRYITEINPIKKYVHEYVWLMGGKVGKPESFDSIEKTFINSVNTAQRMTSYGGNVNTARYLEFIGFVKLDNGEKIELMRDTDEDYVFEKMEKISKKLGTQLFDNTRS